MCSKSAWISAKEYMHVRLSVDTISGRQSCKKIFIIYEMVILIQITQNPSYIV